MLKKTTYEYIYNIDDDDDRAAAFEFEVELMNCGSHYERIICGRLLVITVIENWEENR